MTLSGARNLEFQAVSDFIAQLSLIIKGNTIQNINNPKDENISLAEQINTGRIFDPVVNDPLDDVLEIIDMPEAEHKKSTFPYVEPTVYLPDEIDEQQKRINDDYTDLMSKINSVNDVATEQKKIEEVIESVIDDPLPNNDFCGKKTFLTKTTNNLQLTALI